MTRDIKATCPHCQREFKVTPPWGNKNWRKHLENCEKNPERGKTTVKVKGVPL